MSVVVKMALFALKAAVALGVIYAVIKIYLKVTLGWAKTQVCLLGKTVIITGANTGIGYEAALDFAKRGGRVILACRDKTRGQNARDKIAEETGNPNVVLKILDLGSFESVREFAKDINSTEERLDILVNNAGALFADKKTSVDGRDFLMQVNYFSPFLLTNLLVGLLKKSTPSRIVNVSSAGAKRLPQLDITMIDTGFSKMTHYGTTKLCNILFTIELAKKLEGSGVTTYSLHPGFVKTDIFNPINKKFKLLVDFGLNFLAKTSEEGAQTTIHCALAKGIENYNGEHFEECQRVSPYKSVLDKGVPQKLWEKSESIVGLKPEEIQF